MSVSTIIEQILSEWAYRVDDGMPNPKNPTHLKELGIVLSEMGLSHIESALIENLLVEKGKTPEKYVKEAEGTFKNPVLNKTVKYKNAKGEDAEGLVGNLLRLPQDHPGRKAAEALLPPEGSDERDALNKDLGGQNQPQGAEEPKGDKGGEEGGAPKEDPIQKAAAMFDPKADPAMAARLDKEKETLAQLAGKDTEQSPKEEPKKEEPKGFDPIPAVDVQKEMPQADPDTFGGESDIPDGVDKKDLNKFNTDIQKVAEKVKEAKAKGEKIDINLCQVTIPGTNLYCDDNLGIKRKDMPQFKGKPVPGSRAEKMPLNKDGEVDTEPVFREMLKEKGITTTQTEVAADQLKATQSELGGDKVIGMMGALEENPQHPSITAPIYVSRDGYVIDGHHRWAAIVAYNAAHPDSQIPMKVEAIDMDIKDAIPMCNKFAEDMGIAAKKQGETTGNVGQEPKKEELKPNEKDPESKVKTFKGEQSGEEIKTVELEGGGLMFGTVHRNTKMADDIINQVKASVPKEKWKDIVFVGEGGATGDSGEIEFHDEMEYSAPKFKEMGAEIDTWDGDELDVHDDQSDLYKSQIEQTGLSHSKVKAGNWASMIGQGEGTDTMSPNDYLDDEGKEFLQQSAKEAGFPEIENWDEPTEQDKDTLYRLSFPEDNGDRETGVNTVQVAFNKARDLNLIKKQKELAAKGKIPIVMAGESHTDLVDDILRGKKEETYQMKEDLFPMIDSLIEGIITDFINEANYQRAEDGKYWVKGIKSGNVYKVATPDNSKHTPPSKAEIGAAKKETQPTKKPVGKQIAPSGFRKTKEKDLVKKKTATKAAPKTAKPTTPKKAVPGKVSSKMEDDDMFFSKKTVQDKLNQSSDIIKKLPLKDKEKQVLLAITGKILKGQDLTKAEKEFASQWMTFPATSDPKIYFTNTPGNFDKHEKVSLPKMDEDSRIEFNDYLDNNEVFDAGQPVKKKSMVASKLTDKRVKTKVTDVKKNKEGKIIECKVGKTTFTRYDVPDEKELVKQLKLKGVQNAENEAKRAIVAMRRHNDMMEFISQQGEIESLDWGFETDTPDGRKNSINSIKTKMANKLVADFKNHYKGEMPPDVKRRLNTIVGLLKNLKNPYDGHPVEEMQREVDAIAQLMNSSPEFRAGVPDMQEIFDFMVKLGQGYAGFMPSASNWKVTDIVTYKPNQQIKLKPGQSLAEAVAGNLNTFISDALIEGGLSVKYEKGGASAGADKVQMTVYKKHKNFDTKKEILNLFGFYEWAFTPGQKDRVKSAKEIDAKENELNSVMERARKEGILSEEEITEIQMEGEAQAKRMAAKVEKKVPFKKYKQCFGGNDKEQKANYENYKRQCGLWCKMGALAEKLNNNDMDYQLFGNLRTKYNKKGVQHETIDGVNVLSGMGWSYDPGIAATGKECKFLSLNNANSSHIEPINRKG